MKKALSIIRLFLGLKQLLEHDFDEGLESAEIKELNKTSLEKFLKACADVVLTPGESEDIQQFSFKHDSVVTTVSYHGQRYDGRPELSITWVQARD